MDSSFNAVLNDVNVPNHIDDLDELLNSSWDHKAMDQRDYDALYAELNQSLLLTPVASPSNEAVAVSNASEEYVSLDKQVAESDMLTPQASPNMGNGRTSDSPIQADEAKSQVLSSLPVRDVTLKQCESLNSDYANSKLKVAVRNRLRQKVSQSSEKTCFPVQHTVQQQPVLNYAIDNDSIPTYIQLSSYSTNEHCPATTNSSQYHTISQSTVCTNPLNTVPVSYRSSEEVFMSQPSFSPTTYIPYVTHHSVSPPAPQYLTALTQSNQVIYVDQQAIPLSAEQPAELQTLQASASPGDVSPCCEPLDSMQPTPGMSCAEYLSSVQMSPVHPEPNESPPTYYILVQDPQISTSCEQSPPIQILLQPNEQQQIVAPTVTSVPSVPVPPVSSDRKPVFEQIEPSGDYVQVQNSYVLPSEGTVHAFPVEEIYRVDRQPAKIKKKPRKANINYGTDFYCHICRKEFGKRGSFQQHWRQKHEDPRPFRCDTCGKTYLTEPDLRQHQENHDPTKKQWKCTECDNRYRHMKDRDRHYDSHHGTPGHPCMVEGCDKAFARRDHMLAHLVSHSNRNMREMKKAQEREEKEQGKVGKRGRKRKME